MSEERPPGVLGGLPHSRPHRRSDKRPAMVVEPAAPDAGDAPAISSTPKRAASTKASTAPKRASAAKANATPKRAAATKATAAPKRAAATKASAAPKRPAGAKAKAAPKRPAAKPPPPAREPEVGAMGTAVQAAAELAEIGLMASARALRSALSRLPRR